MTNSTDNDKSTFRHPVDTVGMVEYLETMGGFALADTLKALDNGNLEAARAHAERIKMLEYLAPWIGAGNVILGIRMNYSLTNK